MLNAFQIVRCTRREVRRLFAASSFRAACIAGLAVTLAACSSTPYSAGGSYTVKRGDTLYSISYRHGLDYRDVARWNGIGRDFTIYPGQVLRLSAIARTSAAPSRTAGSTPKSPKPPKAAVRPPSIPWQWPAIGGVATLTDRPNGGHGLTISGKLGQEIRAASSGSVVYLGSGLLGYGQLLIIKHSDAYLSAYGHTQSVAVKEGDIVVMGQRIATMGPGPQGSPMLYFEIRSNGIPGNPLLLLPKR
jgi:lipoprotein NlpD